MTVTVLLQSLMVLLQSGKIFYSFGLRPDLKEDDLLVPLGIPLQEPLERLQPGHQALCVVQTVHSENNLQLGS